MKRNLALAAIGLAIGFMIWQCLFPSLVVPWWLHLTGLVWVPYFCLTFAYATSAPAVLYDILIQRGVWADRRLRFVGIPLFGASIGLLLLGWTALCGCGSGGWHAVDLAHCEALFDTAMPFEITAKANNLLEQADFLGVLKILGGEWARYTSVYAVIAIGGIGLYDHMKPRWSTVSIAIGMLIPGLLFLAIALQYPLPQGVLSWLLVMWGITGGCISTLLVAIVWTVRAGWWKPVEASQVSTETPDSDAELREVQRVHTMQALSCSTEIPIHGCDTQPLDRQTINFSPSEEPIKERR
jgi:hypothetical protein